MEREAGLTWAAGPRGSRRRFAVTDRGALVYRVESDWVGGRWRHCVSRLDGNAWLEIGVCATIADAEAQAEDDWRLERTEV